VILLPVLLNDFKSIFILFILNSGTVFRGEYICVGCRYCSPARQGQEPGPSRNILQVGTYASKVVKIATSILAVTEMFD